MRYGSTAVPPRAFRRASHRCRTRYLWAVAPTSRMHLPSSGSTTRSRPTSTTTGQYELEDVSELSAVSADLLADIQRGDLVTAIEELDDSGGGYTAADYYEQLDDYGYDDVLEVAGLFGGTPEEAQAVKAYKAQLLCRDPRSLPLRQLWCDKFFRSNAATPAPRVPVGPTLDVASEALKAGDADAAETAIESLNLNQLTPSSVEWPRRSIQHQVSPTALPASEQASAGCRRCRRDERRGPCADLGFHPTPGSHVNAEGPVDNVERLDRRRSREPSQTLSSCSGFAR